MSLLLKLSIGIFIGAFIIPRIFNIIRFLDIGETVIPHSPGPCHLVKGADTGSEDMQLVPGTDIVFISTGVRIEGTKDFQDRRGNIVYYDFNKPDNGVKPVTIKDFPKSLKYFNPHGITIWSAKGKAYLFVINHESDGDTVERFEVNIKKYTITYRESIRDPQGFRYMNSLTATSERSFYYTNYKYYEPGTFLGTIEILFQLRLGSMGYYDGEKTTILESGTFMLNGINQSPDGKYLYLVDFGEECIRTYEILSNKSLKVVKETKTRTIVDNISVDPKTGDLWLGCMPVGWKIVHHLGHQATTTSPSQVLKVKVKAGVPIDDIQEVYADLGDTITASTVAVYHKNSLLIGTINNKALHCQVKYVK